MEYLDRLAEEAVRQAIKGLSGRGERPNSKSVPPEARKILVANGRHRVSPADAEKKVTQAVARMKERRDIKAPTAPYTDWALIEIGPKAPAEAS